MASPRTARPRAMTSAMNARAETEVAISVLAVFSFRESVQRRLIRPVNSVSPDHGVAPDHAVGSQRCVPPDYRVAHNVLSVVDGVAPDNGIRPDHRVTPDNIAAGYARVR